MLDFQFMRELRLLAEEVKPDFWLVGEVIHGEYGRWVNSEMLHSVTNYEMHKSIYLPIMITIISSWLTMSAVFRR